MRLTKGETGRMNLTVIALRGKHYIKWNGISGKKNPS